MYSYTCIYLLFAWNQLQRPTLRTSLVWAFFYRSLSLKYLPIKWIVKQQNPKFGKIMVLGWWCWNLANIARELALIYLSTSIYLYLYLNVYINIYVYMSCLHGISCSDPHLEHHSFPDLSIYIYLSIYLYTCVYLLFAWNQLQWPALRTSLFWAFLSLSLSNTYPWNGLSKNKTLSLAKWSFLVDCVGIWPTSQES